MMPITSPSPFSVATLQQLAISIQQQQLECMIVDSPCQTWGPNINSPKRWKLFFWICCIACLPFSALHASSLYMQLPYLLVGLLDPFYLLYMRKKAQQMCCLWTWDCSLFARFPVRMCELSTMAVAHLLPQLSAASNAARNRMVPPAILLILQLLLAALGADGAASFVFTNACQHPVWVGALHGSNSPPLARSGFYLAPSATSRLDAPSSGSWSGTFWARTGCAVDSTTGRFSCATADCGTGDVACEGRGPAPPVTLAEVTLAAPGSGGQDFYDVSLVDGFNVPVRMAPSGGGGDCRPASCAGDVNAMCPADLRVVAAASGAVVACKSACNAYGSARYCCTGQYSTAATCGPTNYSQVFKSACPAAYSYAYDDTSSTFTCSGAASYDITFCPGS